MNRTVLITGASRGLGLSLVHKFLAAGDRVIGISRTKKYWPSALKASPHLERLSFMQADLTSEKEVRQLIRSVGRRYPSLDILINNAGYAEGLARVEELALADFEAHWTHNLTTAFLMCKHTLPLFQKQEYGLIVNISSMAGIRAVPRLFAYSAAKYGVVALTQCIAKENQDKGIRCVTVCPGGINTGMRAALFGKKDASRQQAPDFVARLILEIAEGEFPLESGSDVVVRCGKVTAVHPLPGA